MTLGQNLKTTTKSAQQMVLETGLAVHTDVGGQKHLVEGCHEVVDALHVPASGVPNGPDVQYSLQALIMEGARVKIVSCTVSGRRRLPVASPHASTTVPQVGSLVHRSQSGARSVDRALPFLARMRVPPERRILLAS